ncbi:MAG TPA: SpoIIE family protein phosphatase [Gemmataceae bacterium]|jgi:sigma-B regulation protein RsbU (phosphoserine phosphatase)|nr:SpoIIE family protein phosphatase [Gemmataceae bacterium]
MTPSAATSSPPAAPTTHGLSFRAKLVLGVCGLVLLTGAVVLWLAHRSARASTEELTGSVFREVSGRAATHTRGFVLHAAPVVETLGQLADKGLAVDDPERLTPQLLGILRANPGLTWVSYADEAGTFTGVYRTPEGGLRINRSKIAGGRTRQVEYDVLADGTWKVFKDDDDSGYDPRVRPFYTEAKRAGRLTWLRPYFFLLGLVPGTTCAAPVKDAAGRLRGVLTADFTLATLSEFVAGVSVSEHSRVFLFTDDQVLLAHPDHRGGAAAAAGRLLSLAETGDPLVDAYRAHLRPEYLRPAGGEDFHFFEFRHDGTNYLGSATTFRVGEDLVWVVGVVAPKADFVGDVWRTQAYALAAAAGAVLVAVALAFALASAVSQPVQSLIRFMQRVGGGDLEAKAEFGGGGEFRQLADALNRMITDLRDRLRLLHSLGIAMEVQRRLLPASAPKVRGLDVAGHSTYCDETGGDYFDFLVLDKAAPDQVLVALGDVMGHGVAAALVMAGVRAVLRDRAVAAGDLAELLGRLNKFISADYGGDRFMTMHLSVIDSRTGTMRWVSAGHDPVIVFDPADDSFTEVGEGDLPLGVMDETEYSERTSPAFRPGQILFIGTDGVWEMPDAKGEQYGKDRLREVIRECAARSADEIVRSVRDRLTAFRGDAKSVDDVTFVVVKVLAAEPGMTK